jgi:integrase
MAGTVYQRKDGRWVAAVMRGGQRIARYARSREEAEQILQELLRNGDGGGARGPRLREYAEEWLRLHRPEIRVTTADQYERLLRHHILPALGDLPLDGLRVEDLRRWIADIQERRSKKTARLAYGLLRKILNDAVAEGKIAENPIRRVKAPRAPTRRNDPWSAEQIRAFILGAMNWNPPHGHLFAFLLGTGARIGEALALRWGDVDLQAGIARIRRSATWVRGDWVFGEPKTDAGRRDVHLPEFVLLALRQLPGQGDPDRLIFLNRYDRLPNRSDVGESLRRLLRRLGLPRIRIHDLRHLHAAMLIRAGVDIKTVQQRLGHSSAGFTLQVYGHLLADSDAVAARAVSRFLSEG